MLTKRLPGDGIVVLRGNGENNAPFLQHCCSLLNRKVSLSRGVALAEDDAVQTVVADDAAPKGVVEIEHQTAPALSA
jgi:hypothetical protein